MLKNYEETACRLVCRNRFGLCGFIAIRLTVREESEGIKKQTLPASIREAPA